MFSQKFLQNSADTSFLTILYFFLYKLFVIKTSLVTFGLSEKIKDSSLPYLFGNKPST